jgi:putative transcriptional regulator
MFEDLLSLAALPDITADEIRKLRRDVGLSQEDFARVVGTTTSGINRWENGKVQPSKIGQRVLHLAQRVVESERDKIALHEAAAGAAH